MSNNVIRKGSSITIPAGIDEIAKKYLGIEPKTTRYLIVEGKTDVDAIKRYFYINDIERNFEIRTGSVEEKNGKKIAIEYFKANKDNPEMKVMCLLDRDYDFILKKEEQETNILYYDYFELESYLFDEDIIKTIVCTLFKEIEPDLVTDKVNKYKQYDVEKDFYLLYLIDLYRELNFHNLSDSEISNPEKYAELCKRIPFSGIISGKHPHTKGQKSFSERLESYLFMELEDLEVDLFDKIKRTTSKLGHDRPTTFFDFCTSFYKAKKIINNFPMIFGVVLDMKVKLDFDIYNLFFNTWLPRSKKFIDKMDYINLYFSE